MRDDLTRPTVTLAVLVAAFIILLASMVMGALRRPRVPEGTLSAARPLPIGDTLVGPSEYTIDARSSTAWTFFDFSRNAAVTQPGPLDWDLAFRRFEIIANGGPGFGGQGAIASLGARAFDSLVALPDTGFVASTRDSTNAAIRRWYDYGYTSHVLEAPRRVYAVRTADGRYAKIQIVSYYCTDAQSGCLTFRYVYQGDGSRRVAR